MLQKIEKPLQRLFGRGSLNQPRQVVDVIESLLDQLEARAQGGLTGERVFPFPAVEVRYFLPAEEQRAYLAAMAADGTLRRRVETHFDGLDIRYRHPFALSATQLTGPPQGGLAFELNFPVVTEEPVPAASPQLRTGLRITVLTGKAEMSPMEFDGSESFYIGQASEARERNIINHMVFVGADRIARSVSRNHGHIYWDEAAAAYRFALDRPENTAELFRNGRGAGIKVNEFQQPILRDGDHLRLGKAMVRFNLVSPGDGNPGGVR